MKKYILIFGIALLPFFSNSQIVNGYAKVTAITGAVLTVSMADESADSFEDGEWVVLMQNQDDVIGTTANTALFGDVGAIGSAGRYEIRQIASHTESGGLPATITLESLPNFVYNTSSNSSVQIITFRTLGSPDYTTTADITALAWNGDIGGVIAINVDGTLTLAHNINADAAGFRGGVRSNNQSGPICVAANATFYRENNAFLGFKGEGIYKNTTITYNNGRGKLLNGGGGGSHHNGGGAGGGNYTTGGVGGNGWNNCTTHPAGGLGGLSLAAYISGTRIFMGGGGGGGQQNNTQSRNGGNGGGIVLIRAEEITTVSCPGVTISANGTGPTSSGTNDGGGGGGAGGSISFFVDTWSIDVSCPLNIASNGGNGSSSLSGGSHAGGGGGGQGVIIFDGPIPITNVTTESLNGTAGCGNTSSPCNSLAGTPSGTDNDGILTFTNTPLPITIVSFDVKLISNQVELQWITESEHNNAFFIIERSNDGVNWRKIIVEKGSGNSSEILHYKKWDFNPPIGTVYYRLIQKDFDGTENQQGIRSIIRTTESVVIFPNPAQNLVNISCVNLALNEVSIFAINGELIDVTIAGSVADQISIDVSSLKSGVYIIQLNRFGQIENHKLIITH